MRARDLAHETFEALSANRVRSALTVLGIVIGISAVIAMTALIDGIKLSMISELGLDQARAIYISIYTGSDVTERDLSRISDNVRGYEYVTGISYGSGSVSSDTKNYDASIVGVYPQYFVAISAKALAGRTISAKDVSSQALTCVIDEGVATRLFGDELSNAIGKTLRLDNDNYSIVGVIPKSGGMMNDTVTLYVPITTLQTRISGMRSIDQIIGFAAADTDIDNLVSRTQAYLERYYKIDSSSSSDEESYSSVEVISMKSMIDQVNSVMASFQLLMSAVAGISLIVGGIGIMNMMLTNVTERIREIGLRKALGATRSDITRQFLLESICLCVLGGIIGIICGYLGAIALSGVASGMLASSEATTSMTITPVIEPAAVLGATAICIAIGIIFGYYPARRAAKLDPVESLHFQ